MFSVLGLGVRGLIICLIIPSILFADDYSFDMDEIEVKTYEYKGYLKAEHKYQKTKSADTLNNTFGEAQIDFKYFKDKYSLNTQFQANHSNINDSETNIYTTNQLYLNYKFSSNHSINIGKQSLKWGKGYFFNPIALLDRKKDPNNPEAAKEGFIMGNYKYNKSYIGDVKNFSLDIVALSTSKSENEDFYNERSKNIAIKSYILYLDTDIDFVYYYSDILKDKVALDISKNLETNFEVHGEIVKEKDGYNSHLLGMKYLTTNDLTITSEYFYQSEQLSKTTAFYDNKYLINKFSLKEPFSIVYSTVYYKNSLNINDNSYQNSLGGIYSFKNNISIDISFNKNSGNSTSEFGSKQINDTLWSKVKWYF